MSEVVGKLERQGVLDALLDKYDATMLDHGGSNLEAYAFTSDIAFEDASRFMIDLHNYIELAYRCGPVIEGAPPELGE